MVHRTRPTVKSGRLYQLEREGDPIDVGTPPWYDWLEEHDSFLFVDHVGAVTVRKNETGHGESEWRASRTRLGKVFTVSLGPSRAINLSSLQIAARRLAGKQAHVGSAMLSTASPAASTLPIPQTAATSGSLRSLMRAKLSRPRSGSDVIFRTRLIERPCCFARRFAPQHAREKGFRFLQRKAQVTTTQFGEVPLGQPPDNRQRRIGSADEHQVQLGRQMLNQQLEQSMDLAIVNTVIIIQHQDDIVRHIGQIIDE